MTHIPEIGAEIGTGFRRVRDGVWYRIFLVSVFGSHRINIYYDEELSHRKQIARQLRTQYVEGIMALKYRSSVTQGHWKHNHRTDNTRLTISQVI